MGTGATRGRRVVVGLAVVVAALAIGGIVVAGDDPPPDGVRAVGGAGSSVSAPASTATTTDADEPDDPADDPTTPTLVMGDVGDIAVDLSPRTGLADGEVLTLTVDGVDGLPDGAIALMCTGEVVDDTTAIAGCDPAAVTAPDGTVGPGLVEGEQQVVVSRYLRVASASGDPNYPGTYDCATESAGCGLVLAPYRLPPTAVSVPLAFDQAARVPSAVSAEPATGLDDGQVVTVEASGLRPLASHGVSQCVPFEGEGAGAGDRRWTCDGEAVASFTADEHGDLLGAVRVASAIYPPTGRVDCTATPCALVVQSEASSLAPVAVEIDFADGVVAPTPRIELDPAGPYTDGQEITLRGTGFPPGLDLAGHIGQCPADRDTAHEERCTYDLDPVVVADDGTFTTTRTVSASLIFTGSCADTGCVIGWVINKGTTVAPVPIEVTP